MTNIDTFDLDTLEIVLSWDLPDEALGDALDHFVTQPETNISDWFQH